MQNFIHQDQFLYLIIVLFAVLIVFNIFLFLKSRKTNLKLKIFFGGKKAQDLEGVLFEEIKKLKQAELEVEGLKKEAAILKKLTDQSIKKVGVIRFNPFKSSGGDQSFSIAILDSADNGLVISGLYTQDGTRVYCKPVKEGQSEYPLSKEEERALDKANLKT